MVKANGDEVSDGLCGYRDGLGEYLPEELYVTVPL